MSSCQVIILSGLVGIGKTSALQEWAQKKTGIAGVWSPKKGGKRYFEAIHTGEHYLMDRKEGATVNIGIHSFDPAAFDWAIANIEHSLKLNPEILVIDEIGPLEINKEQGLHKALVEVLKSYTGILIVVVRQRSLEAFVDKYQLSNYRIIFNPEEIDHPPALTGLVLAGGKSRRMGQDKAFINYFGQPQWERTFNQLSPFCNSVKVSINGKQERDWRKPEIAVVDMKKHAMSGPLGGIASSWESATGLHRLFILACDYPRIKIDHLALLAMHQTKDVDAICFSDESGRIEPMICLIMEKGLEKLKAYYSHQGRSMLTFLKSVDTLVVEPPDEGFLRSVNTQEEYLQYTAHLNQNNSRKFNIAKAKIDKPIQEVPDYLAIEEPLEISIETGKYSDRKSENLSVTMRTPLNDEELAIGFMFTEGLLKNREMLDFPISLKKTENSITLRLKPEADFSLDSIKRNFYTTSSCGVCGKESIEAIHQACPVRVSQDALTIKTEVIYTLPQILRQQQSTFNHTGGIHAAAFFNPAGELLLMREDVGRHNALDKLIGAEFISQESTIDCSGSILLLSGRASFELVQKAAMAGVQIVCAIGAPSSLAVETARNFGITLIGFLKAGSFNIYCGKERVTI